MLAQGTSINSVAISFFETAIWFFVGIIISIMLPIIVKTLRARADLKELQKLQGARAKPLPRLSKLVAMAWKNYNVNKYLLLLVGALVLAIILVFVLNLQFYTPRDAAIAGFGWESLVSKFTSSAQDQPPRVALPN